MIDPNRLYSIFSLLPPYLHTLSDLHSLLLTSHTVRSHTLTDLTPYHLSILLFRSLRPTSICLSLQSTWSLLSILLPGLPSWLSLSPIHRRLFSFLLPYGPSTILRLILSYPFISSSANITLTTLNAKEQTKKDEIAVIVSDLMDNCVGAQWYDVPDFWDGGREDAATLYAEPDEMAYILAAWGEVFGRQVEGWYAHFLDLSGRGSSCDGGGDLKIRPQAETIRQDSEEREGMNRDGGKDYRAKGHNREEGVQVLEGEEGEGEDGGTYSTPTRLISSEVGLRLEWSKYIIPEYNRTVPNHSISSDYPYCSIQETFDPAWVSGILSPKDLLWIITGETLPDSVEDNELEMMLVKYGLVSRQPDDPQETDRSSGSSHQNGRPDRSHQSGRGGLGHLGNRPFPAFSCSTNNTDKCDHTLRSLRDVSVPNTTDLNEPRQPAELVSSFIHLFERSPLFRRISKRIRQRVIRIARRCDISTLVRDDRPTSFEPLVHGAFDLPTLDRPPIDLNDGVAISDVIQQEDSIDLPEFGEWTYGEEGTVGPWKQILWEDAIYTGGWAGLELLADEWEWDGENHKAKARRSRRENEIGSSNVSGQINAEQEEGTDRWRVDRERGWGGERVKDDHPAIQRLVRIYNHLRDLEELPERVTLRSEVRSGRMVETFLMPCLMTDLRVLNWDPIMGQRWRIGD